MNGAPRWEMVHGFRAAAPETKKPAISGFFEKLGAGWRPATASYLILASL